MVLCQHANTAFVGRKIGFLKGPIPCVGGRVLKRFRHPADLPAPAGQPACFAWPRFDQLALLNSIVNMLFDYQPPHPRPNPNHCPLPRGCWTWEKHASWGHAGTCGVVLIPPTLPGFQNVGFPCGFPLKPSLPYTKVPFWVLCFEPRTNLWLHPFVQTTEGFHWPFC